MNNTEETLAWYKREATSPPFDPDGMCLKICRTARGIDALYPSALSAQNATPAGDRVTKVADITAGMVLYYDDPNDSNPYGHIVTAAGWVGSGRELSDLVVWTNSVKSNVLTAVRGDYFPRYWGDRFVFAATSLNGVDLELPAAAKPKPTKPKPPAVKGGARVGKAIELLEAAAAQHRRAGHLRFATALERDIAALRKKLR